jgi:hypothetical protein
MLANYVQIFSFHYAGRFVKEKFKFFFKFNFKDDLSLDLVRISKD